MVLSWLVLMDETVNIILHARFSETDEVGVDKCVFTAAQCKKLLEFAFKNNHFIFNHLIFMSRLMEWLWVLRRGPVLLTYLCALLNKIFFLTVHMIISLHLA